MAKKIRPRKPVFPLMLTLQVVEKNGAQKFRVMREQATSGTIHKGQSIFGRVYYSEFSVDLFDSEDSDPVSVDVYEPRTYSLIKLQSQSYLISELGGHYNGSHSMHERGSSPYPRSGTWLNAEFFKIGQVIVISGYSNTRKGKGSPHYVDLAKL